MNGLTHDTILKQCNTLLSDSNFKASSRLKRLLKYLVEETLAGRGHELKAYKIATEILDRKTTFDPETDPIVRVEMRRLRRALEHYYAGQGSTPVRITIPLGQYAVQFGVHDEETCVTGETSASTLHLAFPELSSHLSDPVLTVLPFVNLSGDTDQDHFADGLAEELSLNFARFQNLSVIAYYSTRRFKEQSIDVREAGRQLGAGFVVTGSIRRIAQSLRVAVQLSATNTGTQLWTQQFDRELTASNLFKLQDEITSQVVSAIGGEYGVIPRTLWKASRGKRVTEFSVYEAILHNHHYLAVFTPEAHAMTRAALEHAVKVDPEYALAWAMLGALYGDTYMLGFGELDNAMERGLTCAQRALAIDPLCPHAHYTMGHLCMGQRDRAGVIRAAENLIDLNPNEGFMVGIAGWFLSLCGDYDRGMAIMQQSFRLNPYYPSWFHLPPLWYYHQERYEAAWDEAQRFGMPDVFWGPLIRAAVLGQLGRQMEAHQAWQQVLALRPDFQERAWHYVSCIIIQDDVASHLLEGLQKAGAPVSVLP
ncbi:tetratricopeptide repeat protein [Candidatus Entotheonella palauensis]|uniref:tetratricopeptide repeat protein n=1 Tax=Candidatus Entotheonella palauensis TaxID=93172 RepID=UPI000B7EB8C0|nr:hypothetical protein [Candidatus Entotheonella palauensis]